MSIWNSNNQDRLDKVAHKNLVVDYTHFENPITAVENYKDLLKQTYSYFPDIQISLTEIIPNDAKNRVTVVWNYRGTHKNGKIFGFSSTGKKVKVQGITVLEIEEGLVKAERGIVDNMSLFNQLSH